MRAKIRSTASAPRASTMLRFLTTVHDMDTLRSGAGDSLSIKERDKEDGSIRKRKGRREKK